MSDWSSDVFSSDLLREQGDHLRLRFVKDGDEDATCQCRALLRHASHWFPPFFIGLAMSVLASTGRQHAMGLTLTLQKISNSYNGGSNKRKRLKMESGVLQQRTRPTFRSRPDTKRSACVPAVERMPANGRAAGSRPLQLMLRQTTRVTDSTGGTSHD